MSRILTIPLVVLIGLLAILPTTIFAGEPFDTEIGVAVDTSDDPVEPAVLAEPGAPGEGDEAPSAMNGQVVLPAPLASVDSLLFSPDGKTLYAGLGYIHDKSEDQGYVLRYDLMTNKQTARFSDRYEAVKALAISPNNPGVLLTGDIRPDLEEWDLTKSPPLMTERTRGKETINGIAFTPDGKSLVVGELRRILVKPADDSTSDGRDLTGGEVITQAMDISADGKYLASVNGNHEVVVFNLADGSVKAKFASAILGGFHVAFSPKANVVAFQDDEKDETIAFGDVETGAIVGRLQLPESSNPGDSGINNVTISNLVFSPDGKLLLAGGRNGDAYLYEVASGQLIKQILDHKKNDPEGKGILAYTQGNIAGVAFTPDSKRFATAATDATIRIYDVAEVMKSRGQVASVTPGNGGTNPVPVPGLGGPDPVPGEPTEPGEPKTFPIRIWKTADGKHSIKASLVGVTDGVAELNREDGQLAKVPVPLLSARDIAYLKEAVPSSDPEPMHKMRFWTTADGKSRIKATFVSATADAVTILREDGQTATVPLNILHERDRRYVAEFAM